MVTESFFILVDISGRLLLGTFQGDYSHHPVFLQTDVTALQTQCDLGIFWPKTAPSNSLVQQFLWKNRKSGIFEALFQ